MIRVAIVEDNLAYVQQLQDYILQYEQESGNKLSITVYEDGEDIVANYRPDFDIILMDIEMRFMNGMTAAECIRKVDEEVNIIFITNVAQYAIRGYAVNALDYLLKPVSYFAFSQRLDRAVVRRKKKEKTYLIARTRNVLKKVFVGDIYYIESQGHNILIHTIEEVVPTSGTLKGIEEKLSGRYFSRCNNGYLVNLEYVDRIQEGMVMIGRDELTISRPRKKAFMEELAAYMKEMLL